MIIYCSVHPSVCGSYHSSVTSVLCLRLYHFSCLLIMALQLQCTGGNMQISQGLQQPDWAAETGDGWCHAWGRQYQKWYWRPCSEIYCNWSWTRLWGKTPVPAASVLMLLSFILMHYTFIHVASFSTFHLLACISEIQTCSKRILECYLYLYFLCLLSVSGFFTILTFKRHVYTCVANSCSWPNRFAGAKYWLSEGYIR